MQGKEYLSRGQIVQVIAIIIIIICLLFFPAAGLLF
jgi:hypothetical protein